jgi:RimJ/RimL family protein N-acetyltransferase
VGFADHKRDISPSLDGIPEIGWALTPEKQGLGYATEAVGIALTWADEHLATPQTAAIIHPDNISSIRIAEKTGYVNGGTTVYKDQPTTVFRRDKRDKAAF